MAEFLICLDFETTCFPSRQQLSQGGWYQEIVDFGAALIDLSDGRIETTFQQYVQPTEFYSTRLCHRKLGISPSTLEDAPPLPVVLTQFGRWMKQIRYDYDLVIPWHIQEPDENAYFCTWSNMDLGYYLKNEANHKFIKYANYLKWWVNGQKVFQDVYGWNARLHDAANHLDTPIVGSAHNAVDDAKTLAYLMHDMWVNAEFRFRINDCR